MVHFSYNFCSSFVFVHLSSSTQPESVGSNPALNHKFFNEFFGIVRPKKYFFSKKNQTFFENFFFQIFPIVVPWIFLSLRYGADLGRSRLVHVFQSSKKKRDVIENRSAVHHYSNVVEIRCVLLCWKHDIEGTQCDWDLTCSVSLGVWTKRNAIGWRMGLYCFTWKFIRKERKKIIRIQVQRNWLYCYRKYSD